MKIENTISFKGHRSYLSADGNTEEFTYEIVSKMDLNKYGLDSLINMHGMGGQSQGAKLIEERDGVYIYRGTATRYSD